MIFTKTKLEGVYVLTPRVFTDTRGYFFESYSKREFEQNGLHYDFVQDNQSFSSYGTIRGLHFQKGEHAQAKLVRASSPAKYWTSPWTSAAIRRLTDNTSPSASRVKISSSCSFPAVLPTAFRSCPKPPSSPINATTSIAKKPRAASASTTLL